MPLFEISGETLKPVEQTNFPQERSLQRLIETNLQTTFGCRFVASEFSTGNLHAGRIDTLALSEDSNPVIIEYKKVESSELINQSLFYLAWIHDHRGDFEIAVQKSLGPKAHVDWSDIRVMCIAPNYRKYDLHAVQVMGANIELWTYRMFKNGSLYLEEVLQRSYALTSGPASTLDKSSGKNPVMVAAGKKAAITKATGSYNFEQHVAGKPHQVRDLALAIQDYVTSLDPAIEEVPKKLYVAYKSSKNIACMEVQHQKVLLFLKLNPKEIKAPAALSARDVSNIGHFGTGDLEVTLKKSGDLDLAKPLIRAAYEKVGG